MLCMFLSDETDVHFSLDVLELVWIAYWQVPLSGIQITCETSTNTDSNGNLPLLTPKSKGS